MTTESLIALLREEWLGCTISRQFTNSETADITIWSCTAPASDISFNPGVTGVTVRNITRPTKTIVKVEVEISYLFRDSQFITFKVHGLIPKNQKLEFNQEYVSLCDDLDL